MVKWIKTTSFGDYRDPLQNHKFDGQLLFDKKGNFRGVYDRINNILSEARWYFGKHIGSKKLSNIVSLIRRTNETRAEAKKLVQEDIDASNTGK